MEKLVIQGGMRLSGSVTISGAKNAAVAIIAASILVDGVCKIENIPDIKDVFTIVNIIQNLGAKVTYISEGIIEIDSKNICSHRADYDQVKKMRASYYLLGALLGRFKCACVAMPGGCDFGARPIDQHIKGFEALGATVNLQHGLIEVVAPELRAGHVYLDTVSVGATINIMLAAVFAKGTTIIENSAKEPHIVDLANFLNAMGAKVKGAGTDIIRIIGVDHLKGGCYSIIPDQIEAGTFMIAAAAVGDDVLIKNVIPKHMDSLTAKLIEIGAQIEELDDAIRVKNIGNLKSTNIKTMPYPGFPTDLQPQMVALLSASRGVSVVTEGVWDNRFQYADELKRMGAKIHVDGRTAVIEGVSALWGAPVRATDLRAGAGMIIAALMADGETEITELKHIDRGYVSIENKLCMLGAKIERVDE